MNKKNSSLIQLNKAEELKFDESVSKALRKIEKSKQIEKLAESILEGCKANEGYSDSLMVEKYFDYSVEWNKLHEKPNDARFRIECLQKVKEKMLLQMTEMLQEVLAYVNSLLINYELHLGRKEIAQGMGSGKFQYVFKFTIDVKKVVQEKG